MTVPIGLVGRINITISDLGWRLGLRVRDHRLEVPTLSQLVFLSIGSLVKGTDRDDGTGDKENIDKMFNSISLPSLRLLKITKEHR